MAPSPDRLDAGVATQAGIAIAGAGTVRVETRRAFSEDEYRESIAGLP